MAWNLSLPHEHLFNTAEVFFNHSRKLLQLATYVLQFIYYHPPLFVVDLLLRSHWNFYEKSLTRMVFSSSSRSIFGFSFGFSLTCWRKNKHFFLFLPFLIDWSALNICFPFSYFHIRLNDLFVFKLEIISVELKPSISCELHHLENEQKKTKKKKFEIERLRDLKLELLDYLRVYNTTVQYSIIGLVRCSTTGDKELKLCVIK